MDWKLRRSSNKNSLNIQEYPLGRGCLNMAIAYDNCEAVNTSAFFSDTQK